MNDLRGTSTEDYKKWFDHHSHPCHWDIQYRSFECAKEILKKEEGDFRKELVNKLTDVYKELDGFEGEEDELDQKMQDVFLEIAYAELTANKDEENPL